jgi:hypothetical protein
MPRAGRASRPAALHPKRTILRRRGGGGPGIWLKYASERRGMEEGVPARNGVRWNSGGLPCPPPSRRRTGCTDARAGLTHGLRLSLSWSGSSSRRAQPARPVHGGTSSESSPGRVALYVGCGPPAPPGTSVMTGGPTTWSNLVTLDSETRNPPFATTVFGDTESGICIICIYCNLGWEPHQ